jgi:AraC-like DNA-binding protein
LVKSFANLRRPAVDWTCLDFQSPSTRFQTDSPIPIRQIFEWIARVLADFKIGLPHSLGSGSSLPMPLFLQIDQMARGGSIALFVLWSWILLRDHRQLLAARIAVAMNLTIIGYVLTTAAWSFEPSLSRFTLMLIGGSTPGLFWLFARTWFNDRQRVEGWAVALIALSVLNIAIMQLTFESNRPIHIVAGTIFRLGMFAFAAAGLWEAWRGRQGDLVEVRRRMRPRIVAAVGIYVILIAIAEIAVYTYGAPPWIARSVGSSIVVITLLFCMAMFGMTQADLFGAVPKPAASSPPPQIDQALTARLLHHMQSELPHRDEEMTIAKLATQLGEQEYRLRRHINGAMGYRNFAAFLNSYRLAEVKTALADPSQRDVPIITIALDAGFGSLGPFNRAFRDAEGMTPSEFRARQAG